MKICKLIGDFQQILRHMTHCYIRPAALIYDIFPLDKDFSEIQIYIKDFIHNYGTYEELSSSAGFNIKNIIKKSRKISV